MTLKIHYELFEYLKFLFEDHHSLGEDLKKMSNLEAYEKIFDFNSKPYKLIINTK